MSLTRSTLLTQQAVMGRIVTLGQSAAEVQAEIHLIGCSTMEHISLHGDTTGAVALMNALPRGQRVKSLGFWFKHYSNSKISMVLKDNVWTCKLAKDRDAKDFDIDGAMATTFADLTTERDPVTLTLDKFIKGLERTANNSENFDGTETPKVAPAVRAVAAQMVAIYRKANAIETAPVLVADAA